MNLGIGAGLHNRFDFVVIEKDKPIKTFELGDMGEYQAQGTDVLTAHNVIVNNMWTRLCNRQTFGGYIHVGKGTGTPAASDTKLFSWLASKKWTQDAQFRGFDEDGVTPLGYWRGYIEFNEAEQNGKIITEVGVGYGTNATDIVTHALLQDAEGNPISFEKTDTKILRIYATIYSTLTLSDKNAFWINPKTNNVLVYLTGGTALPNITVGISNARGNKTLQQYCNTYMNAPSTISTKALTTTADINNKRIVGAVSQFSSSEALINCINSIGITTVGFVNINQYDNPSANGVDYSNKQVGVGDGIETRYDVPSYNTDVSTVSSSTSGSLTPKSELLPCYMTDNSLVDFTGIANIYYSKYNMIKDETGNLKAYLYKNSTTLTRMYKGKQWDYIYGSALASYTTVFSADSFGTDDGYIFYFNNMTMLVGTFQDDVFSFSQNYIDIIFDEPFEEPIIKAYVYKNKRFLLISENYAGFYEQVSRNEFIKLWKIQTVKNNLIENNTSQIYKEGNYWSESENNLPSEIQSFGISNVYDSINNRILIVDNSSNIAYMAKYNDNTNRYDYFENNLPLAVGRCSCIYDNSSNSVLIIGTSITYMAKYNSTTDRYEYFENNLPTTTRGTIKYAIYDNINNRIFITVSKRDTSAYSAYMAKYNSTTDRYEYFENNLPTISDFTSCVFDSVNNRIIITFLNNSIAYMAKYNSTTDRYEYFENNLPTTIKGGTSICDIMNNRILIVTGYAGGGNGSNVAYMAKYNSTTDRYEYFENNLPITVSLTGASYDVENGKILLSNDKNFITASYNHQTDRYDYYNNQIVLSVSNSSSVYDIEKNQIIVTSGGESHKGVIKSNLLYVAKYNELTGTFSASNRYIIAKNVNTSENPIPKSFSDAIKKVHNIQYFALSHNKIAINNGNDKTVIEFDPITLEYVRQKLYTLNTNMDFVSTPEIDAIISAYNTQYFHHSGQKDSYGVIGSNTAGNVAYLNDCILKAPYSMISEETSIQDGVSYVEFDSAPPEGEEVKLSWHCRGYDKQASLGQFAMSVSAYIQFGSQ